jgi:hypothetical protein
MPEETKERDIREISLESSEKKQDDSSDDTTDD